MSRHRLLKNRRGLAVAAILYLALPAMAADASQSPFRTGDLALYPQPQPVTSVSAVTDLKPHPSLAAIPPNATVLRQGTNKGVRIEILQVLQSDEIGGVPAPDGMEAIIVATRWHNILPRQKVARSQLEGGGDRTSGAGSLLGGGGKADAGQMVELDVAYKVQQPGLHLWLVTAGETHALIRESKALPSGVGPLDSFVIAGFNQAKDARLAWFVPKGSKDLLLRFFDYDNGSIDLLIAGDAAAAAHAPVVTTTDSGKLDELEIAVLGSRYAKRWGETDATAGWRYLVVELLGKSLAKQVNKGALVYADPSRYLWTSGDGGALQYGQAPADGSKTLVFTPELPHRQSVAFLVPDRGDGNRIGIRGRSNVLSLRATPAEPKSPGVAITKATDAGTLELALLGMRWDGQALVVELLVSPTAANKGVELDSAQQFLLKAGDSEYRPDTALTSRLFGQPPTPFVIPPATPVRFDLAFSIPAGSQPSALRYRGFAGESILAVGATTLSGQRGTASGLLATAAPPVPKKVAPAASDNRVGVDLGAAPPPAAPASASVPSPVAPPATQAAATKTPDNVLTPKKPAALMPLVLPPFDAERAVQEAEPNNKPEQASSLGKMLAASGSFAAGDAMDWFVFDVSGEAQLWSLEASGPGLRHLGIYTAGERKLAERDIHDKDNVRIDNLQLLPARYWVKVTPSSTGGDYRLRAVPLGRPDRESEFEPNDDSSQAQILRFGEPRRGLIAHQNDRDLYRFSLDSATFLLIELTPPPGLKLEMNIESGGFRVAGDRTAQPGDASRYLAQLQAGDYQITVNGDGRTASDVPYQLQLVYQDPFDMPADLEPNDDPDHACSLESLRKFAGTVGRFRGEDWYRFPAVAAPTAVKIRVTGRASLNLRPVEGGSLKYGKLTEDVAGGATGFRSLSATLDPGAPAFLQVSGSGDYAIELALEPDPDRVAATQPAGGLELSVKSKLPALAAFREETQRLPVEFSVTNRSAEAQSVALESVSAADGWYLLPARGGTLVASGQSAVLNATLIAGADRIPRQQLPLYVRARSDAASSSALQLPASAQCGAEAVSPERDAPLPETLLGGFNVAWRALGAELVADEATRGRQSLLLDGMTPLSQALVFTASQLPADITVALAGGVMPVAGVVLFPAGVSAGRVGPASFTLLASTDGATFSEVHRGVLETAAREQAFALAKPVQASHLRLHLESAAGLRDGYGVALAEFKVIAATGATPFAAKLPNIADPALGGHLVSVSWPGHDYAQLQGVLTEAAEKQTSDIDRLVPVDWVIGFHHERAARIQRLEWQDDPVVQSAYRRPEQVAVAASVEGPNGPWLPLVNWELNRDAAGMAAIDLDGLVWARFLRFSVPSADKRTRWQLAETLRVFEQGHGTDYRSILAEWGHYRRDAFYEMQPSLVSASTAKPKGGGANRASAVSLAAAGSAAGRASAGTTEDWYRIKVPADLDRLEFRVGGDGRSRLLATLENAQGTPIELQEADDDAGQRVWYARVQPGSDVWLKVAEANRSIMIVWDNSASVRAYHDGMYQAIARLADEIRPGSEVVNLMPLRDKGTNALMSEWSANAVDVKAAIGGYDRSDSSSDSEKTLIAAMERLAKRPGNRAIVLLTDAESPGDRLNSTLWQRFREVRPRLFTLELQLEARSEKVAHYQDLMQDWAAVNHGDYQVFRTQADLDHAFERAACLMRRPADYTVAWQPAPGKGSVRVVWESGKAMAGAAVELVLDASGSMRSSKSLVAGKLKMEMAREVMQEIIQTLPDDTQVGLRVYGHRVREGTAGDCQDSELVAPIAKLDRVLLSAAVNKVQALGTTPIAYSIGQACGDLAKVAGPKLLVVITDGKEECQGDPEAAVAACRASMEDLRVDIVGFALADANDKSDMERAATKGAGRFFDAQDGDALSAAIEESLAMPFEVFDSHEVSIATGLTGPQEQALYEGNYTIAVHTASGDVTVRDVAIREKKTTTVYLSREGDGIRFRIEDAQ